MRRIMLFAAALILGILLAPALAAGAMDRDVYLVKPDGTGDFPTIQAAISALDDGAIIELAAQPPDPDRQTTHRPVQRHVGCGSSLASFQRRRDCIGRRRCRYVRQSP